jgi:hypothetical protein
MVKTSKLFFLSFLVVVFFLTTLSLAYHHHDLNFAYSTCSLCKAKGSLSQSVKTKIDKPCPMAANSLLLPSFLLAAADKASAGKVSIYNLFKSHGFSNKSPPARS